MLTVDVLLSPREAILRDVQDDRLEVVVAIDVLRMTTNAVSLFHSGVTDLHVVEDVPGARRVALRTASVLLGERGGLPPTGFDGGNSPTENASRDYDGRTAVLCTTNGSRLVQGLADADHLMLGAMVNARSVAEAAVRMADTRVTLACAGNEGATALDDVMAAGCIVRELIAVAGNDVRLEDSARVALSTVANESPLSEALLDTSHGRRLTELGYREDVLLAAELNSMPIVPVRVPRRPPASAVGGELDELYGTFTAANTPPGGSASSRA